MRLKQAWMWAVVAAAMAGLETVAQAALWVPSSGSTANFTYTNGHDTNGLFGNPTVEPTGFTFAPPNFVASASNNSSQQTWDYLTVDVTAKPGTGGIKGINFSEIGDYSIFNGGGVNVQAYLLVQVLDNNWGADSNYSDIFKMPVFAAAGTAVGDEFIADLSVDFGGRSAQSVRIIVNNILQAFGGPGGSAIIQKKLIDDPDGDGPGIEIIGGDSPVVPEPVTLAALGGLVTFVVVRRKR